MEAAQAFNWPITVYYEDTDAGGWFIIPIT